MSTNAPHCMRPHGCVPRSTRNLMQYILLTKQAIHELKSRHGSHISTYELLILHMTAGMKDAENLHPIANVGQSCERGEIFITGTIPCIATSARLFDYKFIRWGSKSLFKRFSFDWHPLEVSDSIRNCCQRGNGQHQLSRRDREAGNCHSRQVNGYHNLGNDFRATLERFAAVPQHGAHVEHPHLALIGAILISEGCTWNAQHSGFLEEAVWTPILFGNVGLKRERLPVFIHDTAPKKNRFGGPGGPGCACDGQAASSSQAKQGCQVSGLSFGGLDEARRCRSQPSNSGAFAKSASRLEGTELVGRASGQCGLWRDRKLQRGQLSGGHVQGGSVHMLH